MPRFFVDTVQEHTALTGADAQHISRSLRMKAGDELILCDGTDFEYQCRIEQITGSEVLCKLEKKSPCLSEPTLRLTLYQAIPKLDKLEMIIQKGVELGVYKIVPVLTSRCVVRPDEKSFRSRLERYEKISLEAAKQSGRGRIPQVCEFISFKEALEEMRRDELALICYEKGGSRLEDSLFGDINSLSLLIGSEGGFEPAEAEAAKAAGVLPIFLGHRILRCETAPLAAISIIMNRTGNI